MKILIPVDPEIPVPPKLYGGVERLVDGLITEYTRQGHEVYLLAHEDSTARDAAEIFRWKGKNSRNNRDTVMNAIKLWKVARKVQPDIIHHFARLLYTYPALLTTRIPFVMTYGREISPKSTGLASFVGGNQIHFTAAAGHMLNHLKRYRHKFVPVYNFTDVHYFTPKADAPKEHLMYLGRIEDIKGIWEAIQTALATEEKLIIAGNIQPGHEEWFEEFIRPHLSNPFIEWVGPVNDEQKRYYLQRAKAILFPIKWEEPFGIVMIEAMACGTPVIAFRRGSVPEVIKEGRNGFIVNNTQEMTEAVDKIPSLSREFVRKDCAQRFSREKIAGDYLKLFERILIKN